MFWYDRQLAASRQRRWSRFFGIAISYHQDENLSIKQGDFLGCHGPHRDRIRCYGIVQDTPEKINKPLNFFKLFFGTAGTSPIFYYDVFLQDYRLRLNDKGEIKICHSDPAKAGVGISYQNL